MRGRREGRGVHVSWGEGEEGCIMSEREERRKGCPCIMRRRGGRVHHE